MSLSPGYETTAEEIWNSIDEVSNNLPVKIEELNAQFKDALAIMYLPQALRTPQILQQVEAYCLQDRDWELGDSHSYQIYERDYVKIATLIKDAVLVALEARA